MIPQTRRLRLVITTSTVLAMVIAGLAQRSPWIVLLAAPAYTAIYLAGKWPIYRRLWQEDGSGMAVQAALFTLPVQAIVAGIFYALGLGLAWLFAPAPLAALSSADAFAAAGVTAALLALSAIVIAREDAARAVELEPPRSGPPERM